MADKPRDDGGPAFPSGMLDVGADQVASAINDGMTLRDYFAAQAISTTASLVAYNNAGPTTTPALQQAAEFAYALADAMLEARKK